MLIFRRIVLAVSCLVVIASCSPLRYSTRTGLKTYSREVPVVIAPYHDQTRNGSGELVRLLLANGYDVITIDKSRIDGRNKLFGNKRKGDFYSYTKESVYILEIKCTAMQGNRNKYEAFHATLSDGDSGRIILVADLVDPKGVKPTIKALVRKMNTFIK